LPNNCHHFAGGDFEVQVVKKVESAARSFVGFAKAFNPDDGVLLSSARWIRIPVFSPQFRVPSGGESCQGRR
jgi:hypothetical protein